MKSKAILVKFYYVTIDITPYIYELINAVDLYFLLFLVFVKIFISYCLPLRNLISHLKNIIDLKNTKTKINEILCQISLQLKNTDFKLVAKYLVTALLYLIKYLRNICLGMLYVGFQIFVIVKFIRICLDG